MLQAHSSQRAAAAASHKLHHVQQILTLLYPVQQLQKLTDKHIQLAEQLGTDKAKEIRVV